MVLNKQKNDNDIFQESIQFHQSGDFEKAQKGFEYLISKYNFDELVDIKLINLGLNEWSFSGDIETSVSNELYREDIESEITTITNETFNSTFLSEYPNAWLTIKPADSSNQVTFSIMPSGDDDGNPIITDPNKVVCSGGGYSFVSCVSDWFDLNPDGCLVITQSGGSFSANDEGC